MFVLLNISGVVLGPGFCGLVTRGRVRVSESWPPSGGDDGCDGCVGWRYGCYIARVVLVELCV